MNIQLATFRQEPPLDVLTTDEIAFFLRALRTHRELIEVAQLDTKRLMDIGERPCYVVDFQEVHTFMFCAARGSSKVFV